MCAVARVIVLLSGDETIDPHEKAPHESGV